MTSFFEDHPVYQNFQSRGGGAFRTTDSGGVRDYEVRSGDTLPGSPHAERAEYASTREFYFGREYSISFDFLIEAGATVTSQWGVLTQIQQTDDPGDAVQSPPLAMMIYPDAVRGERLEIVSRATDLANTPAALTATSHFDTGFDRDVWYTIEITFRMERTGDGLLIVNFGEQGQTLTQVVNYVGPIGYNDAEGMRFAQGVYREAADETLSARYANLVVTPDGPPPDVLGTSGNDQLVGDWEGEAIYGFAGDDTLNGIALADTLYGGSGDDTYIVDVAGDLTIENADEGVDLVQSYVSWTLADHVENLTLFLSENLEGTGNALANTLRGNAGDNVLRGLEGDDDVSGNDGDDTLYGGGGNDVLRGANDDDQLYGDDGGDTLFGNDGVDHLIGGDGDDLLYGGEATDTLIGDDGDDTLYGNEGDDSVNGADGADQVRGDDGDDTLVGGAENDTLYGDQGDDFLNAGPGNDVLRGGDGENTLYGGAGDDAYFIATVGDIVVETAGGGNDTVYTDVSYSLSANADVDELRAANLSASNDIDLYGSDAANRLLGSDGDNVLDGRGGADRMLGYGGDDIYYIDNVGDTVAEFDGNGVDEIRTLVSFTIGSRLFVERLSAAEPSSTTAIDLTGFSRAEQITGNNGVNRIFANGGNDIVAPGGGADTLDGGDGVDLLDYGTLNQRVSLALDSGRATTGGATQTIAVGSFENIAGSMHNDELGADGAANVVNGGGGDDVIRGRGGADHLMGDGGADSLFGDGGGDTLEGGSDADDLRGRSGNDLLRGGAGDDLINGDGGNDRIEAGAGNDLAFGRSGADRLFGDDGSDTLNGDAGNDTLDGGFGADVLNGGAQADELRGRGQNDTLNGGDGNDSVFGDGGNDVLNGGFNEDDLRGRTVNDTLNGDGGFDLLNGDGGNDLLRGGEGVDTLRGRSGDDTLDGGGWNDTLGGDGGDDRFIFAPGYGHDTILDFTAGAGGIDRIDLAQMGAAFNTIGEIRDATTNVGGNAVIDFGGGDSLTLIGVQQSQLSGDDFIFI